MGVTGLWRLIEPTGKPVPIETLENKVLAVDISIWLHQVVKGYQDAKGAPLPNAHLMGLFQRLCKLLYFRIKPVFVFDGAFPDLKKETIAKRQDNKSKYQSESERLKRELALLLSKRTAISSLLGKQLSPKKAPRVTEHNDDELFKLPALPEKVEMESESESDDEESSGSSLDLHSVDLEAESFKNMPINEKYDLLVELKETRKMNSWGKLHELPKKSDTFSDFQMQRLLKRRKLQACLQETEKEMGTSGMSLNDLESILNEEGIDTKIDSLPTRRIASSDTARFILISNVKEAINSAKQREIQAEEAKPGTSTEKTELDVVKINKDSVKTDIVKEKKDELDEDLERAIKMSLECADDEPSTSNADDSWATINDDSEVSLSSDDDVGSFEMAQAKAYLLQNTDFTEKAITEIIKPVQKVEKPKSKNDVLNEILAELNREKSMIMEKLDMSSDDDFLHSQASLQSDKFLHSDIDINTASDDESSDVEVLNESESSVAIVTNKTGNVVTVDNSIDESVSNVKIMAEEPVNIIDKSTSMALEEDVSSSDDDDDFEEVADSVPKGPVVELTLNVGEAPEDDIFADIFTNNAPNITKQDVLKSEAPVAKKEEDVIFDKKLQEVLTKNVVKPDLNKSGKIEPEKNVTSISKEVVTEAIEVKSKDMVIEAIADKLKTTNNSRPTVKKIPNLPPESNINLKQNQLNEKPAEATTIQAKENTADTNLDTNKKIDVEKLNSLAEEIQNEEKDLLQEKGRMDRVGRNITEQMTKEAQELLQIFGIPYIVAPMEAEAQCAFLESANLTDGTITDDSDIWLFGGRTVYKNFFNQKKHVLQFLSERIEKSFNLSREQLILLAMLVGSDYTTGVPGVGPVTALEILASFPYSKHQLKNDTSEHMRYTTLVEGLREFKKWVRSGKRTDDTSLKKKLKNVVVNDDFPSVRVVQAYLEPNVEKSEEKFSWGELDITILRDYTKAKFGWSQHKLDEIIKPVIKRLEDRNTQKTLQNYFKRKIEFQSLEDQMSKRVKAAVQRMDPNAPPELSNVEEKPKKVRKRKAPAKEAAPATLNKEKGDIELETVLNFANEQEAGPSSKGKRKKLSDSLPNSVLKVATVETNETKAINIKITKTDRYQEIIPQREKDKQSLLQNKLKAIEVFRKTKMDPKIQSRKRRAVTPKEDAGLSESDSD